MWLKSYRQPGFKQGLLSASFYSIFISTIRSGEIQEIDDGDSELSYSNNVQEFCGLEEGT